MVNHESYTQQVRRDVVNAAKELEAGQVDFIDGIRRLSSMRHLVSQTEHDPDFALFVAIDSETDHLPGTPQRSSCSAAWLEQCDREIRQAETLYSAQVRHGCTSLIARFTE